MGKIHTEILPTVKSSLGVRVWILRICLLSSFALHVSAQTPQIDPGGVVNAASLSSGTVSPGSVISIFGHNLAIAIESTKLIPLPTDINGTRVAINGVLAPLFFVSPTQINAQIPWELGACPRKKAGRHVRLVERHKQKRAIMFHGERLPLLPARS